MSSRLLIVAAVVLALYAVFLLALVVSGRRGDVRAVAGFVPDCLVLAWRLRRDERVSRRHKLLLGGLAAYLAMPFDLVPDFIPVAGQLDDVVVVVLVLRAVARAAGPEAIRQHWPGPEASLSVVLRLAC